MHINQRKLIKGWYQKQTGIINIVILFFNVVTKYNLNYCSAGKYNLIKLSHFCYCHFFTSSHASLLLFFLTTYSSRKWLSVTPIAIESKIKKACCCGKRIILTLLLIHPEDYEGKLLAGLKPELWAPNFSLLF